MTEELPRFHAVIATCCGIKILRFDLPTAAPQMLAQDAVNRGWQLGLDGNWTCNEHLEQP